MTKTLIRKSPCFFFALRASQCKSAASRIGQKSILLKKIRLQFKFVSLVSPFLSTQLVLKPQFLTQENRILLKQSYIMLMWFYYLTLTQKNKDQKPILKFFSLPTKKFIFTSLKAPMAHKNFSKEQYKKQFFKIVISFPAAFAEEVSIDSTNAALALLLITKKQFPQFESNLLFLKSFWFFFYYSDVRYFNYYTFFQN